MFSFFLDASAAAKRYVTEPGTDLIDHLVTSASPDRFYLLNIGYAEVVSIFVRKRNAGVISVQDFIQARFFADADLSPSRGVNHVVAETPLVDKAIPFVETYSLNATDAVVLRCALELRRSLQPKGDVVLVSSDDRLVRAAKAEGLATFNPETDSQAALDAFLNAP